MNEVAGVSGLVFPDNRVDLFLIHQPDEALPYADLLAQDFRALAVGSEMNNARDKPGGVKTITVAVNPVQAQKLTLAISTGEIRLSLRPFRNKGEVRLQTLQVSDRTDDATTRLVRKPGSAPVATPRAGTTNQRPGQSGRCADQNCVEKPQKSTDQNCHNVMTRQPGLDFATNHAQLSVANRRLRRKSTR